MSADERPWERAGALDPDESERVAAALETDPELAEDLRPLLDGRYGEQAERLFLRRFAERLRTANQPRDALLPALADVLREAEGETRG